ncbi:MAG: hypothetical protein ABIY55_35520, partial [Kofleriaceae bacterium]
ADGQRCFSAVIEAAPEEHDIVVTALREVCSSLRDSALRAYLNGNANLIGAPDREVVKGGAFDRYLEPETRGSTAPDGPNFYVVVSNRPAGPGISEICLAHDGRRDPKIRISAMKRQLRLDPQRLHDDPKLAMSWLVNTLAHETTHLYSKSPDELCQDLFNDDASDVQQCHLVSYVVGNAAGCSYLARQNDQRGVDWKACMTLQADNTPGYQHGPRDNLGCVPQ